MEEITKLNPEVQACISVLIVIPLFWLYYFTDRRKLVLNSVILPLFPSQPRQTLDFVSEKLTGIFFTGMIPVLIITGFLKIPPSRMGIGAGQTYEFRFLVLLLMLVTLLLTFLFSRKQNVQEMSADLKLRNWYPGHVLLYSILWIFYIFGYELLFRGILWFLCFEAFGFWPALLVNLLLYSLVHIGKGKFMALGAIPTGLILCLLSHLTGSFLPAFLIHSIIAVMTGLFSVYHNPDVHLHFNSRRR